MQNCFFWTYSFIFECNSVNWCSNIKNTLNLNNFRIFRSFVTTKTSFWSEMLAKNEKLKKLKNNLFLKNKFQKIQINAIIDNPFSCSFFLFFHNTCFCCCYSCCWVVFVCQNVQKVQLDIFVNIEYFHTAIARMSLSLCFKLASWISIQTIMIFPGKINQFAFFSLYYKSVYGCIQIQN